MDEEKNGKNGTFLVHIGHCENATWQGTVTWAEKNLKKHFRSALELIRLIDDALLGDRNADADPAAQEKQE